MTRVVVGIFMKRSGLDRYPFHVHFHSYTPQRSASSLYRTTNDTSQGPIGDVAFERYQVDKLDSYWLLRKLLSHLPYLHAILYMLYQFPISWCQRPCPPEQRDQAITHSCIQQTMTSVSGIREASPGDNGVWINGASHTLLRLAVSLRAAKECLIWGLCTLVIQILLLFLFYRFLCGTERSKQHDGNIQAD